MVKSLTHQNSTTTGEVRKALLGTGKYWGLKLGVSKRLGVSQAAVSRAASGKHVGRYRRIEIALLVELARLEPDVKELLGRLKSQNRGGSNDGGA